MKILTRSISLIILLLPSLVGAESLDITQWYLSYNSSPTLLDIGSWEEYTPGDEIKSPIDNGEDFTYVWLKGEWELLPEMMDKDFTGLHIPSLFMTDRVYINGTPIDETTLEDFPGFDMGRHYFLPGDLLRQGSNSVHIRLGFYSLWMGELSGPVKLMDNGEFMQTLIGDHRRSFLLPMAILLLLGALTLSFTLRFLFHNRDKDYLLLLLRLILGIASFFSVFSSTFWLKSMDNLLLFWQILLLALTLQTFFFYQSLNRKFLWTINRLALPFYSFTLLLLTSGFLFPEFLPTWLKGIFLAAAVVLNTYSLVIQAGNRKEHPLQVHSFIDFALLLILMGIIYLYITWGIAWVDPSSSLVIITLLICANLSIYYIRLESKRRNLIQQFQNQRDNSVKKTSSAVEEIIQSLLDYIHGNYTQPIYRDQLAKMAGLNLSYFSSQFNLYTGCKVNQYINGLRLKHSLNLLKDSDKPILEIAFDAGFESLSTFNRLFKETYSQSPGQYRKKASESS